MNVNHAIRTPINFLLRNKCFWENCSDYHSLQTVKVPGDVTDINTRMTRILNNITLSQSAEHFFYRGGKGILFVSIF